MKLTILHGTDHVIEVPEIHAGNPRNDYGSGFYCTESMEMAKEWACKENVDGFVNVYDLEMDDLNVLNLSSGDYTILNWIAILMKHRTFDLDSELAVDAREYLIEHFGIDVTEYDVVIGYRADDSYFQYAKAFVSNALPLRQLNQALNLGELGEQIVLISPKAYEQLTFREAFPVDRTEYFPKFISRDTKARAAYRSDVRQSKSYLDDIFVMDILRQEMKNDDARIQRIVLV